MWLHAVVICRRLTDKGGSGSKDIFKITSQSELSKEYFDSLINNGTINSGGRSGGNLPTQSAPNSYYTTPDGHVIIYGDDGYRLMDISKDRIKIEILIGIPIILTWDAGLAENLKIAQVQ